MCEHTIEELQILLSNIGDDIAHHAKDRQSWDSEAQLDLIIMTLDYVAVERTIDILAKRAESGSYGE